MINEYMYVKYVKTAELQRVLDLLNGNKIASLKGTRSYSKNIDLVPIPHLPYITVNELRTNKLKLCFNSLINGEFSKEETFNLLNSVDEEPLSVVLHELQVFCKIPMKKYPRVTIRISKELLRKIDKAWKNQKLGGRSAGIKWLIQKGLDAL